MKSDTLWRRRIRWTDFKNLEEWKSSNWSKSVVYLLNFVGHTDQLCSMTSLRYHLKLALSLTIVCHLPKPSVLLHLSTFLFHEFFRRTHDLLPSTKLERRFKFLFLIYSEKLNFWCFKKFHKYFWNSTIFSFFTFNPPSTSAGSYLGSILSVRTPFMTQICIILRSCCQGNFSFSI